MPPFQELVLPVRSAEFVPLCAMVESVLTPVAPKEGHFVVRSNPPFTTTVRNIGAGVEVTETGVGVTGGV
jgi:hypothetical protein